MSVRGNNPERISAAPWLPVFVGARLPAKKNAEIAEACKDCSGQVVSRCT